jgi:hypothetical protein
MNRVAALQVIQVGGISVAVDLTFDLSSPDLRRVDDSTSAEERMEAAWGAVPS